MARAIRNTNFKNGLCEIDSDGRILHAGFLMLFGFVRTDRDNFGTSSHQEESISSLQMYPKWNLPHRIQNQLMAIIFFES